MHAKLSFVHALSSLPFVAFENTIADTGTQLHLQAGEAALVLAAQRKNLAKRRGVHVACVAPERGASRDPATCASLLAGLLPR